MNKLKNDTSSKEKSNLSFNNTFNYAEDDIRDAPILFIILSLGLSYGAYYIITLFSRINQHHLYYIPLYQKISLYGYLFPLCIICTCILCLYARFCLSKNNFLRFMTLYVVFIYLFFGVLFYLCFYIGFMGYGNSAIFSFRPFIIFWGFLAPIPSKFTIISLTFFILWSFILYALPITSPLTKKEYSISYRSLFIPYVSFLIVGFYLCRLDINAIFTFIITNLIFVFLSFKFLKNLVLFRPTHNMIALFFIYTIFPLLSLYLFHSNFLMNFAYK